MRRAAFSCAGLVALFASACGDRSDVWDAAPEAPPQIHGLTGAVAVVDAPAHRVLTLSPLPDQELRVTPLPVGKDIAAVSPTADKKKLLVLARGVSPRRSDGDEFPSLTVIDGKPGAPSATRYVMEAPLGRLAVDPEGRYAVAYAGVLGSSFVENPNELVIFDLSAPPGPKNPVSRTLRSYGGRPQRLTFSPVVHLPQGPRRLLLAETEHEVHLLDLDNAAAPNGGRPEITVRLSSGGGQSSLSPAGVVVDDGDPAKTDDTRVGIRVANGTSVVTLQLVPAAAEGAGPNDARNDFDATINMTEVGGIPSDAAFVRTDGGLRLAALVPSLSSAVLVEPETSVTTTVKLPTAYTRMSLVTDLVGEPSAGADVALLWSGGANPAASSKGVAFWTLGKTAGQPYRSVEVLTMNDPVTAVQDVPPPNRSLKILQTGGQNVYVLDLRSRTAAPLGTAGIPTLSLSPDGQRLWAFAQGQNRLAALRLDELHPIPLVTDAPVHAVFDVAKDGGGAALLAVHPGGALGVTVFDALSPDTATSRTHGGLLVRGLR